MTKRTQGQAAVEIRHYTKDLAYKNTSLKNVQMDIENCITTANAVIEMEELFGASSGMKEITPCNVVVRGHNGRFIKWRNK